MMRCEKRKAWAKGVTDRQHEAALRHYCGEPQKLIAMAMGLKNAGSVRPLLERYQARGGSLVGAEPLRHGSLRMEGDRVGIVVSAVPFLPMSALARLFGVSASRIEQVVMEFERWTCTTVTRYHETKLARVAQRDASMMRGKAAAAAERERKRMELLTRVDDYRREGVSAVDICKAVGHRTQWPSQVVNNWLREWERRTGGKRCPGHKGRRPRTFSE